MREQMQVDNHWTNCMCGAFGHHADWFDATATLYNMVKADMDGVLVTVRMGVMADMQAACDAGTANLQLVTARHLRRACSSWT